MWWIALLNTIAALASAGFGPAALVKPGLIAPSGDGEAAGRFYSSMYAGRAIPLGAAVGGAIWFLPAPSVVLLLGIAALAQIADIGIGSLWRLRGMIVGAVFAVVCHVAAIAALL